MPYTLEQLNTAPLDQAAQMLDGLYEHSPWIAEQALAQRPFASLAALKHAMVRVLDAAGRERSSSSHSRPPGTGRQGHGGPDAHRRVHQRAEHRRPDPLHARRVREIQQLNADYNAKFGWPFILAVRGPRGTGLNKAQIIATFERRLHGHPDFELAECLRNIHRIAEIRLNDKFGAEPTLGNRVWDWHEDLAQHSDPATPNAANSP
jgi:beta-ureidopropionase / N-carbamoyl-L-amino-acid hydrolase